MISRMIDIGPLIIMLSLEWSPIAFMGIIRKDDFFRDMQKSSNNELDQPKLSGFIPVAQIGPDADLASMMRAMSMQIAESQQADPGERNRAGLCVDDSYGFDFYYDCTGIYLKENYTLEYERYFPFDKLYSGDLDLDMDPATETETDNESLADGQNRDGLSEE